MDRLEIQLKSCVASGVALMFCLVVFSSPAQTRKFTNVKGAAVIVNVTPEEAKNKAIEAAKVEAMRLAGVTEWIQSFDFLEKKESGGSYDEFFHSLTSVQTLGSVTGWELKSESKKIDDFNNLVYEVSIDATVQLYKSKKDPAFQLSVKGLSLVYKNESKLAFDVLPKQPGYLKIFLIDERQNVAMLFPNEYESSFQMEANSTYSFPQSSHFEYEMFTDFDEETNYLFFLFTRKDILCKAEDFKDFLEYVYSIEPQDRFATMEKVVIYK